MPNENIEIRLSNGNIYEDGFGMTPKRVIFDTRLSMEAKCIYTYLTTYTNPSRNTAFPSLNTILTHLNTSKTRFYSHRKQLIDYGYITVEQKRDGNGILQRNVYTINLEVPFPDDENLPLAENEESGSPFPQIKESPFPRNEESPFPQIEEQNIQVKHNKQIKNNTSTTAAVADLNPELVSEPSQLRETPAAAPAVNPLRLYQEIFGVLNPIMHQDIQHWIDDLSAEVVCEAMKRAAFEQKNYRYAQGIMRSWASKNITTLEQVKADDVAHENASKARAKPVTKHGRIEKLPDYIVNPPQEGQLTPERKKELDDLFGESLLDVDESGDPFG